MCTGSKAIDKYLADLLSVQIPWSSNKEKAANATLCISLETAKLLHSLLIPKIESLQEPLNIYLTDLRTSLKLSPEAFTPQPHLFDKTYQHFFKSSKKTVNYIVLHNNVIADDVSIVSPKETWEALLHALLLEINLKLYYNICLYTGDADKEVSVERVLRKVKESPELFGASKEKRERVRFLAQALLQLDRAGNGVLSAGVKRLAEKYVKGVEELKEKNLSGREVDLLAEANRLIRREEEVNGELETETIPALVASHILDMKDGFSFSIKEAVDHSRSKKPKTPPSQRSKSLEKIEDVLVAKSRTFKLFSSKIQKKLDIAFLLQPTMHEKEQAPGVLLKGNSIPDFIAHYSSLPETSSLMADKNDASKLRKVYRKFLRVVNWVITRELNLPIASGEQLNMVVVCVERHMWLRLYSWYGKV